MHDLRTDLESELQKIEDVDVHLYKDTELMCVFYRGKEFAHFHDEEEIDIRMSQKFIKKEGLVPLEDSQHHPNRSKKSRWMQIRFTTSEDVAALLRLVERLIEEEYKNTTWSA